MFNARVAREILLKNAWSDLGFSLTSDVPSNHEIKNTKNGENHADVYQKSNTCKSQSRVRPAAAKKKPQRISIYGCLRMTELNSVIMLSSFCLYTCSNFDLDFGMFDVLFYNNRSHNDTLVHFVVY